LAKVKAYPGCPDLAFMIASRITNPYADADAIVTISGRRGSGKSTTSLALAEGIARWVAKIRNKGESPEKFFTLANVKTISPEGALSLFSGSDFGMQENSVFLIDDSGTQWSSRRFFSETNMRINETLQICRVYRCCIIFNFISEGMIDLQGRGMSDYKIQILWKNVKNQQVVFKCKMNQGVGSKDDYGRFLRWHGKRLTRFVIGRPSLELEDGYKRLRRQETDKFVHRDDNPEAEVINKPHKLTRREINRQTILKSLLPQVKAILDNPDIEPSKKTDHALAKSCHTTRYWSSIAIAELSKDATVQ
jgi:hypothetical protein